MGPFILFVYSVFVYLFTYLLMHLFTYLLMYLFTYLLMYLFTYLLMYLFTYLLMYLFTYLLSRRPAILRRIIPVDKIASITYENQFSTAIIGEDTQIVIIDEWSDMSPNLAKSLLQGGWMVGAVKHNSPRFINNNIFFVFMIVLSTCNKLFSFIYFVSINFFYHGTVDKSSQLIIKFGQLKLFLDIIWYDTVYARRLIAWVSFGKIFFNL